MLPLVLVLIVCFVAFQPFSRLMRKVVRVIIVIIIIAGLAINIGVFPSGLVPQNLLSSIEELTNYISNSWNGIKESFTEKENADGYRLESTVYTYVDGN